MISMIFCTDMNGGIGINNDLLFNIPDDMKFFKEITTGHKVVMGYNTWLSLPKKPLPNRENYVLYDGEEPIEGAKVLKNIDELKELSKNEKVFVIGGATVYNELLYSGLVDEAYVTMVNVYTLADVFVDLTELNRKLVNRYFIKDFNCEDFEVQLFRYSTDRIYV